VKDEGFREIQLNGKQLIFMAMAATVVLVVAFLFGVLVGRGVRDNAPADTGTAAVAPDQVEQGLSPAPPQTPTRSGGAAAAPEDLSYAERLLRDAPPPERLNDKPGGLAAAAPPAAPSSAAPPPAAPAVQEPTASPPPDVRADAAAAPKASPPGPGFAVQVAAYRDRREADTLAKRLNSKGYPAFVMEPVKGAPTALFRVRVGTYKTLKDAEAVSARLQTAEQFTTAWIAR
jgi:DedD protein